MQYLKGLQFSSQHSRSREPSFFVIHAIHEFLKNEQGEYLHYTQFIENLGLSFHYAILPDGSIFQHLTLDKVGYHAKNYNTASVGIELVIPGPSNSYEAFLRKMTDKGAMSYPIRQYSALADLITNHIKQDLVIDVNTGKPAITYHSDLGNELKKDPGVNFDRVLLNKLLLNRMEDE